jgi:hypothetical protein
MASPERDEQAAAPPIDREALGIAGEVEPPRRLDPGADSEDQQGLTARIGHVAPRRRAAIETREVRRSHAGRGASCAVPARVAQLEDTLAAEQRDAAPVGQARHGPGRPGRRGELAHSRRAAAGECAQTEQHGAT